MAQDKQLFPTEARNLLFQVFNLTKKSTFLYIIIGLLILCDLIYTIRPVGMWVGFGLAAYAAIANDSIQTIGTFIASNLHRRWWYLWIFMGLIFLATVTYSWIHFDGDITYHRLQSKGFSEAPGTFSFLHLATPVILLILTRLRMPVSTTFLLLNAFSTSSKTIIGVRKSLIGYFLAFFSAIFVWFIVGYFVKNLRRRGESMPDPGSFFNGLPVGHFGPYGLCRTR